MRPISVVGPGAEDLARTLVDRLAEEGRVARVRGGPAADGGAALGAAATTRTLGPDGWHASGPSRSLTETLDALAPEHDYAVVTDHPEAALPTVALGGVEHGGTALVAAPDADAADPDEVAESLADTEPRETLDSLVERVTSVEGAEHGGAVATFTGRVRARDDPGDTPTVRLEFEKYEGVAEERMAALEADLEEREDVIAVELHHRTGVIEAGEDIVFVVVLAGHRRGAFRTVEDGIDRLKEEVPIFKKEVTLDGEFWVHEDE